MFKAGGETLEPAGGKEFPVFPPSYAGEGTNAPPVYDLNGIEWGEVLREKSAKDGTKRITRYIKRARHCTMDSPQSHANRTEIAFRDAPDLRGLVPQARGPIEHQSARVAASHCRFPRPRLEPERRS